MGGNKSEREKSCDELFQFAIDRGDVARLAAGMPELSDAGRATVEHELQILRIISVGWSLSYYMPAGSLKTELTMFLWEAIHGFSQDFARTHSF